MFGIGKKKESEEKRESRENQSGSSKEVVKMGNMIYKPERKYLDENGEVKIPDDAIAVQRQVEEVIMKDGGIETKGIRVYYSYLLPVAEEAPEPQAKEERSPVVARKR
jgi:hypothetical protein